MRARSAPGGIATRSALPNAGVAASSLNVVGTHPAVPIAASAFVIVRSRESSTNSVAVGSRRSNCSSTVPASVFALKSVVKSSTMCFVVNALTLAYDDESVGMGIMGVSFEPQPARRAPAARRYADAVSRR